jgi:hypothetical protein
LVVMLQLMTARLTPQARPRAILLGTYTWKRKNVRERFFCFFQYAPATYVGSVLVLAEKRQVEEDGQRSSVGGEDDNLRDTSVEGLGGLVGTLLELAVVAGLLHKVEDLLGESLVGDGPCGGFGGHDVGWCLWCKVKGVYRQSSPR